jgi:predicted DsbA family dithiol-disulfide isomerase
MSKTRRRFHRAMMLAIALILAGTSSQASRSGSPRVDGERQTIITLIEYSDFQCPFAADGQRVIERVLAVYGQAVNYEYRHHPFKRHPHSMVAAERYEAIRIRSSAAADTLRRTVFRDQSSFDSKGEKFLDEAIMRLGFDPGAIARESKSPHVRRRLNAQMREVEDHNFTQSPSYILAGVELKGPKSFADFEKIICRELRKSRGGEQNDADCWSLVQPDWQRLDELDREELLAAAAR